jgi:hypothetical protein
VPAAEQPTTKLSLDQVVNAVVVSDPKVRAAYLGE